MEILIIGSGYVGLTTGACFSKKYKVTLVDIDTDKISLIKSGKPPFFEKDLDSMLKEALDSKKLEIIHIDDPLPKCDLVFICVGTPADSDGYIDLKYVHSVLATIKNRINEVLKEFTILILKSTIVPGTTRKFFKEFLNGTIDKTKFGFAFNPEFLAQGSAVEDTLFPSRIIYGGDSQQTENIIENFYTDFYEGKVPIVRMSIESAEFTKYAANCFLATKISFANEFANIVENVPCADIDDIMTGIGFDPRISSKFLGAGIGFGGSCFPKDTRAMIRFAEEKLIHTSGLLNSVIKVNEDRHLRIIYYLLNTLKSIENRKIAILGITFKPGTDDTRDAPSIKIISALSRHLADIHIHDPLIERIDFSRFSKFTFTKHSSVSNCLKDAEACLILTEWDEYKKYNISDLTTYMKSKIIIDGRRIFVKKEIPSDVTYITIGSGLNMTLGYLSK